MVLMLYDFLCNFDIAQFFPRVSKGFGNPRTDLCPLKGAFLFGLGNWMNFFAKIWLSLGGSSHD